MRNYQHPLVIAAIVCAAPSLQAAISISSSTAFWDPVMYGDQVSMDAPVDHQTGIPEGDIVGNAQHPSFYTAFSDGEIGFRIRVAGDHGSPGFQMNAWVGVDFNGDGRINFFVGALGTSAIGIYRAGADDNISPSTTSITTTNPFYLLQGTAPAHATNFSFMPVSAATDPTASTFNVDGGKGAADTDQFVSFKIPFSAMQDAVTRLGIPGASIDESSPLRYVVATSNQSNSLNQDLNNINAGQSSASTWATLGGLTSSYSATGVLIPEPSSLGLASLTLLLIWRRRRP